VGHWLIISTLIIGLMPKKADGIQFQDPELTLLVKRIMDGFVDDTTIWQNLHDNLETLSRGSIGEIADRLKTAAQWWEQLLHATGGQLELPKCFFYLLHWVFDSEGRARLATPEELNITISLRQSVDDQDVEITQRCCTTSHRTLGVHENPSGNSRTEYEHLLAKGKNMAHMISAQLIARPEGWIAYRSIYLSSMGYSLPSTSFTRRELSTIQRSPIRALLSTMGFNRNMPLEVVFGPISHGGLGLRHLYVEQGCQKTSALLQHIRQQSRLGKMMCMLIQWTQVTVGVGFAMLTEPWRTPPHAVGQWLPSLCAFLADSECSIEISNTYTVCIRRVHDRILMEDAMSGNFTDSEIRDINRCRVFLQVECLSDVCTADGLTTDPGLQAQPPMVVSQSAIKWPRQGIPGPRSWATWRIFIKTYTRDSTNNRLRQTLGPWTRPDLRKWPTYYDSSSQMLCQIVSQTNTATLGTSSTSWTYHPAAIESTRRFIAVSKSDASFQDSRPPPDAVPVTVLLETTTLLRCSIPPMQTEPVHDAARALNCDTFAAYVATLPLWEQDLLAQATEVYCPDSSLYELLQQRNVNILVASDGGQKDDFGSFGWVIGTKDEVIWDCEGTARGYPMQSYRAEGYGRMSLLLFLKHYIRFYNIKPADDLRVTSYCDSSSLLKAEEAFHTRDLDSSSWYLKPDHDVIMTLSEVREGLPFRLISQHVKSHQDDERDFADLTRPEQLNVLADHRATAALDALRAARKSTEFHPLPVCRGYLRDASGHITSREISTLRTELSEYELRAYLQVRNEWSDEVFDSISWVAYGSASAGLTDSLRNYVVKFSHSWLPIGVRERRCSATTDLCPQCTEIETVPHLYRCEARGPWRHRFLIHLHGHLTENKTAADIRCIITKGIENWFLTGDTNDPDSIEPVEQIGWFQVLKGYIPKEWTLKQEGFYRRQRKTTKHYTGEQWTKELIEFFWTHSHTLWKERCAIAHAPGEASPDNSSARSRQAAQQRVEMAYAHAPLMLAHDRRVLDVPLEERLQSRTSELLAWVKTMLPVINRSVHDARAQLQTGHHDIRSYFSQATVATTDHTEATPPVAIPARPNVPLLDIRQRFQSARTRMATLSHDIRQYFPGIADGAT
jgi:hypothetical protein